MIDDNDILEESTEPTKLKDFWNRYRTEKGPNDHFFCFYETPNGTRDYINEGTLRKGIFGTTKDAEKLALLMEADAIRTRIYKSEYCDISLDGRATKSRSCKEWNIKIDADQALIALGIHPLLNKRPKEAKAKPKRAKKRRRFTI